MENLQASVLKDNTNVLPGGGIGWKNGEMTLDGEFLNVNPDWDAEVSWSWVIAGLSLIVECSGTW